MKPSAVKFFNILEQIDEILLHPPTTTALNLLMSWARKPGVIQDYVYRRIPNADWLPHLVDHRAFDRNQENRGEQAISTPESWPQAQYLKRIAAGNPRPIHEQILAIMLRVGMNANATIHWQFADVATDLPADLAAQWAQHEVRWLDQSTASLELLAPSFGKLITRLAAEGQGRGALALVAALLAVSPDPEAAKKESPRTEAEEIVFASLTPRVRLSDYHYEELLKETIPGLIAAEPTGTLNLLCDLVLKSLTYTNRRGEYEKPEDGSFWLRPAIEDHSQNIAGGIASLLIAALRDATQLVCDKGLLGVADVVKHLLSKEWRVFTRVALHLLRTASNPPMELVERMLVDKDHFKSVTLHHEYYHLLEAKYGELTPTSQTTILNWILEPEVETGKEELTAEQLKHRQTLRLHRRLSPIRQHLTADLKAQFEAMEKDLSTKDPVPPDFHAYVGGATFVGSKSPKTLEELAAMSIADLLAFLKSWSPSGRWDEPSPEGLGAVLSQLVVDRPERLTDSLQQFQDSGLNPTYPRCILSGFRKVLETGGMIPYHEILDHCKWIAAQTDVEPNSSPEASDRSWDRRTDKSWRNAKSEVLGLIEDLFKKKDRELPYEHRSVVLNILLPLTEHPEPLLQDEIKNDSDTRDSLTTSINTVRGKALHAIMAYALWVCRNVERAGNPRPTLESPELAQVKETLDKHLDVTNLIYGQSRSDRAVYGQWIPQISYVGPKWLATNLEKIFPVKPEHRPLRKAAWESYLLYSKLYDSVFKTIRPVYQRAVEELASAPQPEKDPRGTDTRLVEHLVILYARNLIAIQGNDLIAAFFRTGAPAYTLHAMDFIGRSLNNDEGAPASVVEKFKTLWDWRLKTIGGYDNLPTEELATFAWWFASGKCGDDWAFPRLKETLKRTTIGHSLIQVLKRMDDVFEQYPEEVLNCVSILMEDKNDRWLYRHTRKVLWTILEKGVAHASPEIQDLAESIVHRIGSMGFLDFREILQKRKAPATAGDAAGIIAPG